LIDPPGFIPSSFTQISDIPGSDTRVSCTTGVPPIARSIRGGSAVTTFRASAT
jgi:hypothetical protein